MPEGLGTTDAAIEVGLNEVEHFARYLEIRARRQARGQALAAKRCAWANTTLGIPVVALTATVGTSIFASLNSSPDNSLKIAVGIVSVLAAALASLQTFFRFSDRANAHRTASAEWATLARKLLLVLIDLQGRQVPPQEKLQILRPCIAEFDKLEASSPDVSDRLYNAATRQVSAVRPLNSDDTV